MEKMKHWFFEVYNAETKQFVGRYVALTPINFTEQQAFEQLLMNQVIKFKTVEENAENER